MPNKIPDGTELLNPKVILEEIGVEKGMKVAELGCGSGFFTLQVARIVGDEGIVYAVDVLKPILQSIESKAKSQGLFNIKIVWSNLEIFGATKIKDEILDFAFIFNILFQSKKRQEILKEAVRMLKKDGRLAVIDWTAKSTFGPLSSERVSPDEVKDLATKLGLELEKEFEAGQYHYGLIFRK